MGTTLLQRPAAIPATSPAMTRHGILYRLGRGAFTFLIILIGLLSGLPIILLFFITAVPLWLSILLSLTEVGILFVLLRVEYSAWVWAGAASGWIATAVVSILLSQYFASTPPITDDNGRVLPGSIATLELVELNGSQQWITIRGHNVHNPVLLFLAGGPGGSELVMTRRYLSALFGFSLADDEFCLNSPMDDA
jgi:hypothetical protein